MFTDVTELLQSYGPGIAGWVLLFVFVAWSAGKGGKLALANVRTLLDSAEELRVRMKVSLDECNKELADRNEQVRIMREEITGLHKILREMIAEAGRLEVTVHRLTAELEHARSLRRSGDIPHDS